MENRDTGLGAAAWALQALGNCTNKAHDKHPVFFWPLDFFFFKAALCMYLFYICTTQGKFIDMLKKHVSLGQCAQCFVKCQPAAHLVSVGEAVEFGHNFSIIPVSPGYLSLHRTLFCHSPSSSFSLGQGCAVRTHNPESAGSWWGDAQVHACRCTSACAHPKARPWGLQTQGCL